MVTNSANCTLNSGVTFMVVGCYCLELNTEGVMEVSELGLIEFLILPKYVCDSMPVEWNLFRDLDLIAGRTSSLFACL